MDWFQILLAGFRLKEIEGDGRRRVRGLALQLHFNLTMLAWKKLTQASLERKKKTFCKMAEFFENEGKLLRPWISPAPGIAPIDLSRAQVTSYFQVFFLAETWQTELPTGLKHYSSP